MFICIKQHFGGIFVDFHENSILGTPPPPPSESCHGAGRARMREGGEAGSQGWGTGLIQLVS